MGPAKHSIYIQTFLLNMSSWVTYSCIRLEVKWIGFVVKTNITPHDSLQLPDKYILF